MKFEFVANLETVKQTGLTISSNVVVRTDRGHSVNSKGYRVRTKAAESIFDFSSAGPLFARAIAENFVLSYVH